MKKDFFYPISNSPTFRTRRRSRVRDNSLLDQQTKFLPYAESRMTPATRKLNFTFSIARPRMFSPLPQRKKSPKRGTHTPLGGLRHSMDTQSPLEDTAQMINLDTKASQSRYKGCKAHLDILRQMYNDLLRENAILKSHYTAPTEDTSTSTIQSPKKPEFDPAERQSMINEVEHLHGVVSTSHSTLNSLNREHKALAHKLAGIQRDLGLMRYKSELGESTKDVKILLLKETLQKKKEDAEQCFEELECLEDSLYQTEIVHSELEKENKGLTQESNSLEATCPKEVVNLAELYEKISLTNSLLKKSEEKVNSYENYIQTHLKTSKE